MGRKKVIDHDLIRDCAEHSNLTHKEIAAIAGCHTRYAGLIIKNSIQRVDLRRQNGAKHLLTRMSSKSLKGRRAHGMLAFDHPAIMESRSIYPTRVIEVDYRQVLKSGHHSAKIGDRVVKGRWKGFSIYTLTLEERRTCPSSCHHWRSCYGNTMQFSERFIAGRDLEDRLRLEILALSKQHKQGFAVRLHVLGDFYSVEYVKLWADLLDRYPQLHIFGFTARWDARRDPIALALIELAAKDWRRFAMRFSNAPIDECATISIEYPGNKPDDAIICPQQIGKTECCGTCALCWQSKRRIAFIQH